MRETHGGDACEIATVHGLDEKTDLIIGRAYARHVLGLIKNAKVSIEILMFHWAWYQKDLSCEVSQINIAILDARKRGVLVRCYCNMLQIVQRLKGLGIDARLYKGKGIMHAKLIIIDRRVAIMGSHNFSQNAMCFNKEISIQINAPDNVLKLERYFDALWRTNT